MSECVCKDIDRSDTNLDSCIVDQAQEVEGCQVETLFTIDSDIGTSITVHRDMYTVI